MTAVFTRRWENRRWNELEVPCSYKLTGLEEVLLKLQTITTEYF